MVVNLDVPERGSGDIYLDDGIIITFGLQGNRERTCGAITLEIDAISLPLDKIEHVSRHHIISRIKLAAEAALTEQPIMLGCQLNIRILEIKLPYHKCTAWRKILSDIIKRETTNFDEMGKVVGRLTHLAIIIQKVLHFLSRMRQLRDRAENRRIITIPETVIQDFKLVIIVLDKAHSSISMNLLTFRRHTHVHRSDAFPARLGGHDHNG